MKFTILTFLLSLVPIETMTGSLTVTEGDKIIELVDREYYSIPYTDDFFVDEEKIQYLLNKLNQTVSKHPIDASLDENGAIVEGVPGVRLDKEKFLVSFFKYFYGGETTTIIIPKLNNYPRVSSELLAEISVNQIGHYTTYYDENNVERSHNILLSVLAINNHVVFPGEEFSFNKVVGERTKEKGYKKAPVIVKGELSEDIGGGICQVSSTLFNAVNLRGIQMVERYSHSRSVPYVPPGKDATVSWWGPDFVFKNNYKHPILIRATSKNGKMVVNIFSAEDIDLRK